MAASVERSRSVSSMRSTNFPPCRRAYNQENKAVRRPPMCKKPVGLGAKRVRTVMVIYAIANRPGSLAEVLQPVPTPGNVKLGSRYRDFICYNYRIAESDIGRLA